MSTSATKASKTAGANVLAPKCHQRLVTEKRGFWKEARMLLEKSLEKEETARRMEEQKNNASRAAPRRLRPRAQIPTLEQTND